MGPVLCFVYVALLSAYASAHANTDTRRTKDVLVEQLNEDNWDRMLIGEWMVEFYAPWCPACKALEPIWEDLASSKKDLNINVGKIDVTNSPGLSGRFMVTALPTIYHVNNGIFRQYKSPRDKSSLIEFVSKKTWMKVDPISSWKNPTSFHMSILSQFFKLSQILRNLHDQLLEEVGLPVWGSYLIFAIATVVLGTILGLFIVCLIDFIFPQKPAQQQGKKKQSGSTDVTQTEKNSDEDESAENMGDDIVDEEESEAEEPEVKESEAKESEAKEVEASEKDKDTKADTSSSNVRKVRKPRKAD
ncbi:PREDICTED: thioredoxin-related transmembrane protein 1-like [Vollenhovia emeryi]|uniref:thioredoxin-related transmembrane protein 1-like n=1 Tax=Vollenhovia emeryi TaxID=411798 RepID=UPI0005F3D5B3|nr:PREDICTED: thioredoxin-related transmembrane protein 1-like [Vollenhovia emeryi]